MGNGLKQQWVARSTILCRNSQCANIHWRLSKFSNQHHASRQHVLLIRPMQTSTYFKLKARHGMEHVSSNQHNGAHRSNSLFYSGTTYAWSAANLTSQWPESQTYRCLTAAQCLRKPSCWLLQSSKHHMDQCSRAIPKHAVRSQAHRRACARVVKLKVGRQHATCR